MTKWVWSRTLKRTSLFKIKGLIAKGQNIYHFGFGESPVSGTRMLSRRSRTLCHRNEYLSVEGGLYSPSSASSYYINLALLPLREKIIEFHQHFGDFGHFSPNLLVLGTGSKELIYQIMNVSGLFFLQNFFYLRLRGPHTSHKPFWAEENLLS